MTFPDFVPLLLAVAVASVSGAYLRYLITKDKEEDNLECTTFEANEIEMKVPKSCFSANSSESEIVLEEIHQKTSTKVTLMEDIESNICKIEGSFQDRERAKSLICAVISNHFAGLLEEIKRIECSKKRYMSPEENEEQDKSAGNYTTKDVLFTDDSIVTLPAFKLIQVFVSSVIDPSCFWVQLIESKASELEELEKEMIAFYSIQENFNSHALVDVSVNDLVAAPFSDDASLYRARVVEVVNSEKGVELDLFYVDYGDDEKIEIERAFSLKPEFLRLQFQAVQCSLANVAPRGERWTAEATDFFCDITEVAKWKVMEAEVIAVGKNGESVLKLFEKKQGMLVDVADELVRHHHALSCSKQWFTRRERAVAGGEEDDYSDDDELEMVF